MKLFYRDEIILPPRPRYWLERNKYRPLRTRFSEIESAEFINFAADMAQEAARARGLEQSLGLAGSINAAVGYSAGYISSGEEIL